MGFGTPIAQQITGLGDLKDEITRLRAIEFEAVDTIPDGSSVKLTFDVDVPAGTTGEARVDAPEGNQFIVLLVELSNDAEAKGNVYLATGAGEIPLFKDTEAGKSYTMDVDEALGLIRADAIILRGETTAYTTKVNTIQLNYSGKVVVK